MRLLVTRPRPDAEAQAETLSAMGHDPLVEPLLRVAFLDPGPLPLGGAQALIATSRNALRALDGRSDREDALVLPLFVTGAASAALARELGFKEVHAGGGGAETLAALVAARCAHDAGPLVHLAGERLAWDLKGALEGYGFAVAQPVLYRTSPAERLGPATVTAILTGALDGVILMSPLTAKTWSALTAQQPLREKAAALAHFCLSANVAEALELAPKRAVAVAAAPREDQLLALIARETAN